VHIFSTHWTGVFEFILETDVGIECVNADAHGTIVAMAVFLTTTDTTDSTLCAMEWFFGVVGP
jgi:hypothetical protein